MTSIIIDLKYIAWFVWTAFSFFSMLTIAGLLYKPKTSSVKAGVELVIVTIASRRVMKSLLEAIEGARRLGVEPIILTDEGAELIDYLKHVGARLVVVPRSYRRDLVGKGRAINYFIENSVEPNKWYVFIDDDNIVMDDRFMYEIPYYEERGYAACNPVLKPRMGRSRTTFVMDWIRYLDDISVFRFFTGLLGKPLVGMHGELLCVKGSVLREIGFGFKSITEDFRFAMELVRRGYKTWQTSTVVSIKSPNSIGDFMRQRSRWFKGIISDIRYAPLTMKAIVGIRVVMWNVGIIGSWLLSPLWIYWGSYIIALPGALAYWSIYMYGSYKARSIVNALITPVYGIIESLSWIHAVRMDGFHVIDKN